MLGYHDSKHRFSRRIFAIVDDHGRVILSSLLDLPRASAVGSKNFRPAIFASKEFCLGPCRHNGGRRHIPKCPAEGRKKNGFRGSSRHHGNPKTAPVSLVICKPSIRKKKIMEEDIRHTFFTG